MNPQTLYREIQLFEATHECASYLADLVFHEDQYDDESLHSALNYIARERNEYLYHNPGAVTNQEIDEMIAFLHYLLSIPPEIRETLEILIYGEDHV